MSDYELEEAKRRVEGLYRGLKFEAIKRDGRYYYQTVPLEKKPSDDENSDDFALVLRLRGRDSK